MKLAGCNILIYAGDPSHAFLRKLLISPDVRISAISIPEGLASVVDRLGRTKISMHV